MKFFVAGLYQETNSFSPLPTDVAHFRREKLVEGAAVLEETRGSNLELAGMVEELARQFPAAEVVPGLHAWGVASGPMTDEAYAELSGRMLGLLHQALPVDAVLLALHGSMGSVSCDNCEGDLLERVRSLVGPTVPVAVSFDSHAVMTARILRHADILVGYRTFPHVDMAETGRRTVTALAAWLAGGRMERSMVRRWTAIIPVDNAQTDSGPMAQVIAALTALEQEKGVLTASVFCPHPWYDTPEHGVTLVAYTRPEAAPAVGKGLERILRNVWERRNEFVQTCPDVAEFFRRLPGLAQPVAAIDAGDVTTAGAPGDSTVILRAALAAGSPRVLSLLVDAPTVFAAWAAGDGQAREFSLGGSDDGAAYNARVPLRAEVRRLADGPVLLKGASFSGVRLDLGPRVLLRAGRVQLLVMRHASLFHDPEIWRSVGVDPAEADVVAQKSHKLFRPAYAGMVRSVVTVETPGCTDRRLSRLPYRKVSRPIFPLDEVQAFKFISNL
ncbi:MAG: M81 family peptidase [Opitutaceae bacterium]|nr:M81 family peptidase [Opitutaceae bacterium]